MGIVRSMARGIAKNHMKAKGMVRICKQNKDVDGHTWFAKNWRYYVVNPKRGAKA